LIIALTVLATLLAAYYGWWDWQLMSNGTTTTALTLQVVRRPFAGKNLAALPYRYDAEYTFADQGGHVRNGRQRIDRSLYEQLARSATDAPVTIHYSRSTPYVNALDPRSSLSVSVILAVIALFGWGAILIRQVRG
jgi:hypothetical protein